MIELRVRTNVVSFFDRTYYIEYREEPRTRLGKYIRPWKRLRDRNSQPILYTWAELNQALKELKELTLEKIKKYEQSYD